MYVGNEILMENERLLTSVKTRQNKLNSLSIYLSELESQLSLLFAASPDIIIFLTEEGKIVRISDAVTSILGYKKEELIGSYLWDFTSKKSKEHFEITKSKKIIYYNKSNTFIDYCLNKVGEPVKLAWRFSICDERERHIIGVATDITQLMHDI